jgi:probable O-glycosylation ligase (exosortase A-associated)
MVLPMILILRREVERPWLRHLLLGAFMLTIVAVLATYSRGALLGLGAVLLLLALRSRARVVAIVVLLFTVPLAGVLLPSKWFERMGTIKTYEEDASAMGRIWAWKLSMRVASDRPLLGAGFQCFGPRVYMRYLPESPGSETDAHNIFFQVLAEHGVTGLVAFLALILSTWATLRDAKRLTKRAPGARMLHSWADMIEISLIAYIVNGFFLSRSYFDLFYHLVAIAVLLRLLARRYSRGLPVPGLEAVPAAPAGAAAAGAVRMARA